MSTPVMAPERSVARVTAKRRLGPDAQVDDKALIFTPDDTALTDPFLVLVEDWFSQPGFDWHPHRGIETVTTVLDGVLEHGDNIGNTGALHPGDVQWMTAGRGIIHRELAFRNEHAHTLQLWLNLPASHKLVTTRYQDLLAAGRPQVSAPGVTVDVVSGQTGGVSGPALTHWPVQGAVVTLEPGASAAYTLPSSHRAFAYVLSGEVIVAGRPVTAGNTAWSDPSGKGPGDSVLALAARREGGKVMIYSGRPIREPVVMGGPFVMNRRTEITQAFSDFHAGKFGEVPRAARLKYDR